MSVYTRKSIHTHGKRSCLWLSGEGIGDEGAKELVKSLANNTTLTSLDLGGTRWCSVTPAFVRMYIHTHSRSTAMQSHTNNKEVGLGWMRV